MLLNKQKTAGLLGLALGALNVHSAYAENSSAKNDIETVTVTARRREENILSVPAAVSVANAAALRREQVRTAADVKELAPGLTELQSANQASLVVYNIRGQGQTSGGTGLPSVIGYLNEIPISNRAISFYDITSVQVLKGPQGTLFGATLTGGAVLYTSQRPDLTKVEGYINANFGNYGKKEFQGAINIPIVADKLALRIAGDVDRRRGFTTVDNIPGLHLDGEHSDSFRASLRFAPSDNFKDDLIFDYYNFNIPGNSTHLSAIDPNANCAPPANFINVVCAGGVPAAQAAVARAYALGPRHVEITPPPAGTPLSSWASSAEKRESITNIAEYTASSNIKFRDLFGYAWIPTLPNALGIDYDGSSINGFYFHVGAAPGAPPSHQLSNEFQVLGDFANVGNFVLGEYLERDYQAPTLLNYVFPAFPAARSVFSSASKQDAVYGQATLKGDLIGLDRFSLTLGGRYTWGNSTGQPSAGVFVSNPSKKFTYTTSIDYKPTEQLIFYVAHRSGFKPGGANTGLALPANAGPYVTYAPETVKDLEIGAKGQFRIGDMLSTTNIALYNQWYSNIQRNDVINAAVTAITNAKSATIKGLEFDTSLEVTSRLRLSAFLSLVDPKFSSYIQPNFGDGQASTPITFTNLSATAFAGVAKATYTLQASYTLPVIPEDMGDLVLSATYYHQSAIYTTDANIGNPAAKDPPYGIAKARLDWNKVMGRNFDVGLYVNNLTNRTYVQGGTAAVLFSQGFAWATYGDPRTFGIEARYSF